jgi:single-strand DNA-binding protein
MADGLNRWCGHGNVSKEPELRVTQGGTAVLKFSIACNERYQDKSGEWKDRVEFVNVIVWGKRGEALGRLIDKGSKLYVEGPLRTSSYEHKDGGKRYKTEVHATQVLLGGKSAGGGSGGQARKAEGDYQTSDGATDTYDDSDLPF